IGGENLGWILSEKTIKSFPFFMRMMMKPGTVYVQDQARKVADKAMVDACWKRVTAWPAKTLIGYHEPPGEGFVGDGQAALVNAALPVMQRELGIGVDRVQWVVEAYSLLLASLVLVGGALGDRYGRKRVFIQGVGLFAVASAACGMAPEATSLILARAVQGV